MDNRNKNIINDLKNAFGLLIITSLSAFLFILFFQPFPLEMLDYNDRLLYVTGFWIITFLLAGIVFIVLPLSMPKWINIDEWDSGPSFILYVLYLFISATAFSFYINYVGKVSLTLYIAFKVILVCLLPLVIFIILYKYKSMKQSIRVLKDQIQYYIWKTGEDEKAGEDVLDIVSDNKSENLLLKYNSIVTIKSADNYFEIYYVENDLVERKLVRGTLKNIESQLVNQTNFVKCHRTSIVNIKYIDKLVRSYSGYSLKLSLLEETIPVSRQYLIKVKNAISAGK